MSKTEEQKLIHIIHYGKTALLKDMAAEILESRAEIARLRAIVDTPVLLPSIKKKRVWHPAGYPEDSAFERGYNLAIDNVADAIQEIDLKVAEDE